MNGEDLAHTSHLKEAFFKPSYTASLATDIGKGSALESRVSSGNQRTHQPFAGFAPPSTPEECFSKL